MFSGLKQKATQDISRVEHEYMHLLTVKGIKEIMSPSVYKTAEHIKHLTNNFQISSYAGIIRIRL